MVQIPSRSLAATALLFASHFISISSGCVTPMPANETLEFPYPELGSDEASDPATTGYFINHLCLNVKNLTESVNFYTEIFGLRKILTLHVSEHYSITYLGHSHGGKNDLRRAQPGEEQCVNDLPASTKIPNTFGHIGMVVPDIKATQARLEAYGDSVEIIKSYDQNLFLPSDIATATSLSPDAVAQLSKEELDFILSVLIPFNKPLIFVNDPDGNMIEIQPQEGAALA
ncbi:hypothetical protein QQZ08_000267 [Neonectria magnoliae]|uniref:VOC domain-containing protein n=1 Tax=Neonectria magnoliae TaxID=2732573 RepID=A0ABR1II81_9HYPO